MSERERWIVYPLLFLALGAALRDKLFNQTRARDVVCEQLYVYDEGRAIAEPRIISMIGPSDPSLIRSVRPGGQMMIDVVRAGTVIADKLQVKGQAIIPSTVIPTIRALRAQPSDRLPERGDGARPPAGREKPSVSKSESAVESEAGAAGAPKEDGAATFPRKSVEGGPQSRPETAEPSSSESRPAPPQGDE